MKKIVMSVIMAAALLLCGCAKKETAPAPPAPAKTPSVKKAPAPVTPAPVKKVPEKKAEVPKVISGAAQSTASGDTEEPTYSATFEFGGEKYSIDDAYLETDLTAGEAEGENNTFNLEARGDAAELYFEGIVPKASGIAKSTDLIGKQLSFAYNTESEDPNITIGDKTYAAKSGVLTIKSISEDIAKGEFSGIFVEIKDGKLDEGSPKQAKGEFTANVNAIE